MLVVFSMIFVLNITACKSSKSVSAEEDPPQVEQNNPNDAQINSETTNISDLQIDPEKIRLDSLKQVYKDQLYEDNKNKANRITTFYILAQQKFYSGEYEEALFLINRAIAVKETADILALKGSIYLGLGSTENFITFWNKALNMDKDLPIPPIPAIVAELKKHGLINETPNRNFRQN